MNRFIENERHLAGLMVGLGKQPFPFSVTVSKDKRRTDAMNRTIHGWFGQIAAQQGDRSAAEVKAECNLLYGVQIKRRDDQEWSEAFGYIFDALDYQTKLRALHKLDIPVTRDMTTKQLAEYMDQMARDYRQAGFALTDPEARKYEGMT